jgi:hypothetical protein
MGFLTHLYINTSIFYRYATFVLQFLLKTVDQDLQTIIVREILNQSKQKMKMLLFDLYGSYVVQAGMFNQ